MLCGFYVFSAFLLLLGRVLCNPTSMDVMPTQQLLSCDENQNKMERKIDSLEASIENLKNRLVLQELLFEQRLMKMEILNNRPNKTINSLDFIDQQQLLSDELMTAFNRIASKLEEMKNNKGEEIFSSCSEALKKIRQNGIYTIKLRTFEPSFEVYCENNNYGSNWTVIQRRINGFVDFYRNWAEYQRGFGDLNGEFFIGLDKLHALTTESPQELLIELEDFHNEIRYAKYDLFAIGNENQDYVLNVLGSYSGNAGDGLSSNKDMKFTTKDRDNDNHAENCAERDKGAFWYTGCTYGNLNGPYLNYEKTGEMKTIYWSKWQNDYTSLKRVQMLIRPKTL